MQPPPHLLFNQPRPKRCATHCYIARNIQSHQQFTKMNPFWPAAAGSAPLYGTKACNLSLMPPTELQGSVLGRSPNPVPDKISQSTSKSSDTAQRNQILLQQALPPGAGNNILVSFFFPPSSMFLISIFSRPCELIDFFFCYCSMVRHSFSHWANSLMQPLP